ncbi:MAG: hypothetical protein Tp1124SUR1240571_16 [Prokaryotic dsDNA virus sp.]|nr:MAG: hypothetical protein Tp1124SUR1240571_16 [Prokaryotic dsDNA virus sp.]|tara:strand:+ start:113 stop:1018 length:906 start_codon:yes stop_codon:yes gene_type:complete
MKITNRSNLPKVIERAVINDPYDSSGSNISTTRLIAPPRIRVLEMRNWDLIEDDVSNRIFSLLGQSVHHILERSKLKVDLAERRLFYKDDKITNGWTLSGQFDLLSRQGDLTDFKVTSAWAALDALNNGKDEWENQLNVLDFLCRKNQKTLTRYKKEVKVKSLNIMAILRDWSKLKVMQSDNYPRKQVVMIPIRRWSEEEQENYVQARIKLHQDAEKSDQLPLCTAKERWRKEDSYALMLDNRKTARRVLPTREEMDKYMKEHKYVEGQGCKVVFRAGEDVRCQHYCSVNQFCSHFMNVSF